MKRVMLKEYLVLLTAKACFEIMVSLGGLPGDHRGNNGMIRTLTGANAVRMALDKHKVAAAVMQGESASFRYNMCLAKRITV